MAGLAAGCALALTACSSSSTTSSSSAAATTSSSSTASAATASKVTLVVYSAMTKAFTQATGIPVKLDDNSTGPLLTQIEASKNKPNWGLLWVDGARPPSPGSTRRACC